MSDSLASPLQRALADQRDRWMRGECVPVELLLQLHPPLKRDPEGLLDLIYQEICLREKKGEAPQREEYLHRFPELADALGVQFDVHQAIESDTNADRPEIPGYELLEEIGEGGMGRVYKAREETLGTLVAVKVLRPDHFGTRAIRKRFLAETRAVTALKHPHIIKVFQVGECDAGPFLVMELIAGLSLEEVIRRGLPDAARAVRWLTAVAEAVHYAHEKGIIHRDLKPANVMIDASDQPRVMDFGMAKILRASGITRLSSTQPGTMLGTPCYMPPEQTGDGVGEVGPHSDVYSLGAILYALLTGRPPFDEGDLVGTVLRVRSPEPPPRVRSLRPDVPDNLESICHKCLHKQPAARYASARELVEALQHFARSSLPVVALASLETSEILPLTKEITLIGRSPECDLVLKTTDVSRRHCQIVCTAGEVVVEDLGSTRGTCVNGVPATRTRLQDGDRLEVARQVFRVIVQHKPDAPARGATVPR